MCEQVTAPGGRKSIFARQIAVQKSKASGGDSKSGTKISAPLPPGSSHAVQGKCFHVPVAVILTDYIRAVTKTLLTLLLS